MGRRFMRCAGQGRRRPRAARSTAAAGAVVLLAAAAGAGAAAALGGCGGGEETSVSPSAATAKISQVAVERAIATSILKQRHMYALVSCPAGIPQQKGRKFTCEAKLTVGTYPMYVTETDGNGHVRYGNKAPLVALNTGKVQEAIQASILAQRNLTAQVRCPSGVLQQKGLKFRCTAKVAGKAYPFEVVETDGNGNVKYVGR
jgi:hypothetical protein